MAKTILFHPVKCEDGWWRVNAKIGMMYDKLTHERRAEYDRAVTQCKMRNRLIIQARKEHRAACRRFRRMK